jgi:hypothetical protein
MPPPAFDEAYVAEILAAVDNRKLTREAFLEFCWRDLQAGYRAEVDEAWRRHELANASTMTAEDFKRARGICGRSTSQWGRALGYTGANVGLQVRQMERGDKGIPRAVARLAAMFVRHGVPPGWDTGEEPEAYAYSRADTRS